MAQFIISGYRAETHGSGAQEAWWMRSRLGLGLNLYPKDFGNRLGEMFGLDRDVQTGDPSFDDYFWIQCNREMAVITAFTPELRAEFMRAHQALALQVRDDVFIFRRAKDDADDRQNLQYVVHLIRMIQDKVTAHDEPTA